MCNREMSGGVFNYCRCYNTEMLQLAACKHTLNFTHSHSEIDTELHMCDVQAAADYSTQRHVFRK